MPEVRDWRAVMRDLLQMAESTHEEDQCSCEEIFQEARVLLEIPPQASRRRR